MARISTYQLDDSLERDDKIIGTDTSNANATMNFSLEQLGQFFSRTGFAEASTTFTFNVGTAYNSANGGLPAAIDTGTIYFNSVTSAGFTEMIVPLETNTGTPTLVFATALADEVIILNQAGENRGVNYGFFDINANLDLTPVEINGIQRGYRVGVAIHNSGSSTANLPVDYAVITPAGIAASDIDITNRLLTNLSNASVTEAEAAAFRSAITTEEDIRVGAAFPTTGPVPVDGSKFILTSAVGSDQPGFYRFDGTTWIAVASASTGPGSEGRGITSISGPTTVGLVDTYTINYSDSTTSTYTVTNGDEGAEGNGISSITGPVTVGLMDTYTINFTDGTSRTYVVSNGDDGAAGRGITSISTPTTVGLVDTYTINYTDSTTSTYVVTNGAAGFQGDSTAVTSVTSGTAAGSTSSVTFTNTDVNSTDGTTTTSTETVTIQPGAQGDQGIGINTVTAPANPIAGSTQTVTVTLTDPSGDTTPGNQTFQVPAGAAGADGATWFTTNLQFTPGTNNSTIVPTFSGIKDGDIILISSGTFAGNLLTAANIGVAAPGFGDLIASGNIRGLQGERGDPGRGDQGDQGSFILQAFQPAASIPDAPEGGSYNATTSVLTPPVGWSATPSNPSAGQILYESQTRYDPANPGNTLVWSPVFEAGSQGPAGSPGANGRTILNGTVAPANTLGADGDFYIDTAANEIYGPKASGAWPAGVSIIGEMGRPGAPGADGSTWFTGNVSAGSNIDVSSFTDIKDGDLILNTTGTSLGDVYVVSAYNQANDTATLTLSANIRGATGAGTPGTDGTVWFSGNVNAGNDIDVSSFTNIKNGDFIINNTVGLVGNVYSVSAYNSTAGTATLTLELNIRGATGAGDDGRTVLNGTAAPTDATGDAGDFYLQIASATSRLLFGPKDETLAAGTQWGTGVELVGEDSTGGSVAGTAGVIPFFDASADGLGDTSTNYIASGQTSLDPDFSALTVTPIEGTYTINNSSYTISGSPITNLGDLVPLGAVANIMGSTYMLTGANASSFELARISTSPGATEITAGVPGSAITPGSADVVVFDYQNTLNSTNVQVADRLVADELAIANDAIIQGNLDVADIYLRGTLAFTDGSTLQGDLNGKVDTDTIGATANRTALTGASVYSDITVNTQGLVTDTAVRDLTAADVGITNSDNITEGTTNRYYTTARENAKQDSLADFNNIVFTRENTTAGTFNIGDRQQVEVPDGPIGTRVVKNISGDSRIGRRNADGTYEFQNASGVFQSLEDSIAGNDPDFELFIPGHYTSTNASGWTRGDDFAYNSTAGTISLPGNANIPLGSGGGSGADGRTILNGVIDPTDPIGADGDFYINTASNVIFGPKTTGVWPAGVSIIGDAGMPGVDGRTVLNGTVDPVTGNGVDGDFYINTTTNEIFGPRAGGAWPANGVELRGPQGIPGPAGGLGFVTLGGTPVTILSGQIVLDDDGLFYENISGGDITGVSTATIFIGDTTNWRPVGGTGTSVTSTVDGTTNVVSVSSIANVASDAVSVSATGIVSISAQGPISIDATTGPPIINPSKLTFTGAGTTVTSDGGGGADVSLSTINVVDSAGTVLSDLDNIQFLNSTVSLFVDPSTMARTAVVTPGSAPHTNTFGGAIASRSVTYNQAGDAITINAIPVTHHTGFTYVITDVRVPNSSWTSVVNMGGQTFNLTIPTAQAAQAYQIEVDVRSTETATSTTDVSVLNFMVTVNAFVPTALNTFIGITPDAMASGVTGAEFNVFTDTGSERPENMVLEAASTGTFNLTSYTWFFYDPSLTLMSVSEGGISLNLEPEVSATITGSTSRDGTYSARRVSDSVIDNGSDGLTYTNLIFN